MPHELALVRYDDLNARQKENYNFQKVAAILADFGFVSLRLSDDWQGADFIAQHVDGETFLKVQLKARLTFNKKYIGKGLYVAFPEEGDWYLYEHDELLPQVLEATSVSGTESWKIRGGYSFSKLGRKLKSLLAPYRLHKRA